MKIVKGRRAVTNKRLMLGQVDTRLANTVERGASPTAQPYGQRVRQVCRSYMKRAESRHQRREARTMCHWYTHEGWNGLQALPLTARTGAVQDRCTNLLDFDPQLDMVA